MTSGASPEGKSKEQALLEEKKKVADMVRMRFARFGDETLSIALGFAMQPTQMPVLLERLELRLGSKELDVRLDAIADFVTHFGPVKFKKLAMQERKKEVVGIELEALPEEPPDATPRDSQTRVIAEAAARSGSGTDARSAAATHPAAAPPSSTQTRPAPASAATHARHLDPASTQSKLAAAQAAASSTQSRPLDAASTQSKLAAPSQQARMVNAPGYQGPDRRSPSERRVTPDRRARLDSISSNKRFGGDRRKNPKGRRKEEQMRPDFWWKILSEYPPKPEPPKP